MDWEAFQGLGHTWMQDLLRDELFAFTDFATVPFTADGALGIGFICDQLPADCMTPAPDDRNGVTRFTVPLSDTLQITAGPSGAAFGITSGQRLPSLRFILIPAAPSANLTLQRWGFRTPAATDPLGGVYVRSVGTGNLFLVAHDPTTGAETAIDLGVAPTVQTDYRLYIRSAGTWTLQVGADTNGEGGTFYTIVNPNLPVQTNRLLPEMILTSAAGGSNVWDCDFAFFRAWRSTVMGDFVDRITARDVERRLLKRCLLGWTNVSAVPAATGLMDCEVGASADLSVAVLPQSTMGMGAVGEAVGNFYWAAGVATFRLCASPDQSPEISTIEVLISTGQEHVIGWIASIASSSQNGAYFRTSGASLLHFVTRQGGVETTTSIAAGAPNPNIHKLYTVRTRDGGVTWEGLVDGILVASHTTNVPTRTTALGWVAGELSNPGGGGAQDVLELLAHCDRRR